MQVTFRWFGENSDTVTLKQIKQIPNCSGLMGFLDYKAAGEVWTEEEIRQYMEKVHAAGLACEVIESVNIHEDIKLGRPTRELYIENYITTLRNLAKYGVKVVIYNFMPVFDWLRTDLAREIETDGSNSMYYDEKELEGLGPLEIVKRTAAGSQGFSLPGWEPERMAELEQTLEAYVHVTQEDLLQNLQYFLERVIPVCEEIGIRMSIHPDDPAWPIFGLPRIAHTQAQFDAILKCCDSPNNTLCLCTGSLGSNVNNDVVKMIRHFGSMNRISCLHVRNIQMLGERRFRESSHLSTDGSLDMFEIMQAAYECCPDVYLRPDHGRMIWDEQGRPGYGLYDRALGIAYLNGLWEAIDKSKQ